MKALSLSKASQTFTLGVGPQHVLSIPNQPRIAITSQGALIENSSWTLSGDEVVWSGDELVLTGPSELHPNITVDVQSQLVIFSGPMAQIESLTVAADGQPSKTIDFTLGNMVDALNVTGLTGYVSGFASEAEAFGTPIASAGANQSVASGQRFVLDGSNTTPLPGVKYLWEQTAGPAVVMSNPSKSAPFVYAPVSDSEQTLEFQLTATSEDGEATTASVSVTVAADTRVDVDIAGSAGQFTDAMAKAVALLVNQQEDMLPANTQDLLNEVRGLLGEVGVSGLSGAVSGVAELRSGLSEVDGVARAAGEAAALADSKAVAADEKTEAIAVKKPAAIVDSVAAAIIAVDNGIVGASEALRTTSYFEGVGLGGSFGTVKESSTRPPPSVGSITHCAGQKYIEWSYDTVISPYQFGAMPNTPSQQAFLQACEDYASANGLTVDLSSSGEWLTDDKVFKRSNSTWVGGVIHNTSPLTSMRSTTIIPGSFHPVHFDPAGALGSYTRYPLSATGAEDLTLTNAADDSNFAIGSLVWVISGVSFEGSNANQYPAYAHLTKVVGVDAGTIRIETPLSADLVSEYGSAFLCIAEEDGVNDFFGNQLFFCRDANIDGTTLISDVGNTFQRGGTYNCRFNFDRLEGKNVIYINALVDSEITAKSVTTYRKLTDIAGHSQRSNISILSAKYRNVVGVTEDSALARIGECARSINIDIFKASFDNYSYDSAIGIINAGSSGCVINFYDLSAKSFTNSAFIIEQNTVPSGYQLSVKDCEINAFSADFGTLIRGFWLNDSAGSQYVINCGCDYLGINSGSFSPYAVLLGGQTPYINGGRSTGKVSIPSGVNGAYVAGKFSGGVYTESEDYTNKVDSDASAKAAAGRYFSTVVSNINETTQNNPIRVYNFKPETFNGGDRFRIKLQGEFINSNGTKTLQLTDVDTILYTFTTGAPTSGNFELSMDVIIQSSARMTVCSKLIFDGVVISDVIDTNIDTTAQMVFNVEGWVENSLDTIRLHGYESTVDKF